VVGSESIRQRLDRWRLSNALASYPGLRIVPSLSGGVKLAGRLAFSGEPPGKECIADEYDVEFSIPAGFPDELPSARETGGRIPGSFHKFTDGTLCLGSPTRLRLLLTGTSSIAEWIDRCLVPYLYGYSYFRLHGVLPFGELEHGTAGLYQDLSPLFSNSNEGTLREFVRLAAMAKRKANKRICPCGSKHRLGSCHHHRVNEARRRLGRRWMRKVLAVLNADGG
jgi:hypothetical protein